MSNDHAAPFNRATLGATVPTLAKAAGMALLAMLLGLLAFGVRYQLTFNTTHSLALHVAVVDKGNFELKHGDLVAFRWTGDKPVPKGLELVKRVVATEGDSTRIDAIEALQSVDYPPMYQGEMVATSPSGQELARVAIKSFSRAGEPLIAGPTGVIPEQRFMVLGDHPDSLDSRYAQPGWVRADQLVGKVVWSW